jgi:hypothetical protein
MASAIVNRGSSEELAIEDTEMRRNGYRTDTEKIQKGDVGRCRETEKIQKGYRTDTERGQAKRI